MAMENPPFMDDFPIETSIYRGFSIAMFDYQRVTMVLSIRKILVIVVINQVNATVNGPHEL